MASPRILLGPEGDLIAKVTSERVPLESPRFHTEDWLIRFDGTTGAMKWVEEMPDYSSLAVDGSGNIVLAWPTLLQKLDADGSLLWAKERESRAPYERANVAVDGDGNILIARVGLTKSPGTVGGDPSGTLELQKLDPDGEIFCSQYLFEFDAAGAPVSNRCVHANDYTLLPGGGFAVAYQLFDPLTLGGETCTPNRENPSDTTDDALVARYGASGELIGKYCTADPGDQIIEGVLPAPGGMLFITGAYGPKLTLPGERVLEPVEPSSSSAMVARIAAP